MGQTTGLNAQFEQYRQHPGRAKDKPTFQQFQRDVQRTGGDTTFLQGEAELADAYKAKFSPTRAWSRGEGMGAAAQALGRKLKPSFGPNGLQLGGDPQGRELARTMDEQGFTTQDVARGIKPQRQDIPEAGKPSRRDQKEMAKEQAMKEQQQDPAKGPQYQEPGMVPRDAFHAGQQQARQAFQDSIWNFLTRAAERARRQDPPFTKELISMRKALQEPTGSPVTEDETSGHDPSADPTAEEELDVEEENPIKGRGTVVGELERPEEMAHAEEATVNTERKAAYRLPPASGQSAHDMTDRFQAVTQLQRHEQQKPDTKAQLGEVIAGSETGMGRERRKDLGSVEEPKPTDKKCGDIPEKDCGCHQNGGEMRKQHVPGYFKWAARLNKGPDEEEDDEDEDDEVEYHGGRRVHRVKKAALVADISKLSTLQKLMWLTRSTNNARKAHPKQVQVLQKLYNIQQIRKHQALEAEVEKDGPNPQWVTDEKRRRDINAFNTDNANTTYKDPYAKPAQKSEEEKGYLSEAVGGFGRGLKEGITNKKPQPKPPKPKAPQVPGMPQVPGAAGEAGAGAEGAAAAGAIPPVV